jgi:hypothetical protein
LAAVVLLAALILVLVLQRLEAIRYSLLLLRLVVDTEQEQIQQAVQVDQVAAVVLWPPEQLTAALETLLLQAQAKVTAAAAMAVRHRMTTYLVVAAGLRLLVELLLYLEQLRGLVEMELLQLFQVLALRMPAVAVVVFIQVELEPVALVELAGVVLV